MRMKIESNTTRRIREYYMLRGNHPATIRMRMHLSGEIREKDGLRCDETTKDELYNHFCTPYRKEKS